MPEKRHQIHFESGMHTLPILWDKKDEIVRRFTARDLSAHQWNSQVARRMSQYQPYVLGLDTSPRTFSTDPEEDWGRDWSVYWPWLPASPRQMSGRDHIHVVSGDILHGNLIGPQVGPNSMLDDLEKIEDEKFKSWLLRFSGETSLSMALGIVSLIYSQRAYKSQLSRRTFLKRGSLSLAGALITNAFGKLSPVVETFTTESRFESIFDGVNLLTKPRFSGSTWLDGRTALVISKTIDAMGQLDLPDGAKGAVVMGFPHEYEANNFLKNPAARDEAICAYAKELCADVWPVIRNFSGFEDNQSRDSLRDTILTMMATTDIYRVNDLGNKYHPECSVERINHYQCPEVVDSLKKIGDPTRFFAN